MAEVETLAEKPDTRRTLRRSWPYLRPHRRVVAGATVINLAATLAAVLIAPAVGFATDALLERDRDRLWVGVGLLAGLVLARMVLLRAAEVSLTVAGERFVRSLRERAIRHLADAPLRFLESHRTGDLLRRTTGEITDMARFIRTDLPDLVGAAATLVLTAVVLFVYSPLLTVALAVVFTVPAIVVSRWFARDAGDAFGSEAAAEATVVSTFTEGLSAREMLQTTGGTDTWLRRLHRDSTIFLDAVRRLVRVQNRLHAIVVIECVTTAVLLGLAGWLAARGDLSVGTVVVFVLASRNLFESLTQIVRLVALLQDSRVKLARLLDLLALTAGASGETGRTPDAVAPLPARGELVADGVSYSYLVDTPVLHEVSTRFGPGRRTGLAGRTGSGKTTLAKLLSGLYVPDEGSVRYAGRDLHALPAAELRRRVVLVPQQGHVVAGSLLDNLALTGEVTDEPDRQRITTAVADLGLQEWVTQLPDGLDTDVGSRGEHLSAGERQLIGLIRAALVDPAVLILDEATADIDPVTSHRIEQAIDRLRADRVLIVIAHRQSTLERLPEVVHLEAGHLRA